MNTNISDEEIEVAFKYTNFGYDGSVKAHREVLAHGCLKRLVPYHNGWTLTCIMRQLGLTTEKDTLTAKGKKFIYAHFQDGKY